MAEAGVTVEREFGAPRGLVWALLSNTDRYDRALGLASPHYRWREVDGQRHLVGEAKQGGLAMRWIEAPYDWVEGRFLQGGRKFLQGPAADGGLRVEVEGDGERCTGRVTAFGNPRGWGLKLLGPVVRAGLRRRIAGYMDDVARLLEDEETVARLSRASGRTAVERVQELLFRAEVGSVVAASQTPVDERELERRRERLEMTGVPLDIVTHLARVLASRPDEEVAQMRPFELARAWGADRRQVLRTFLHGTRAGLVDLCWQVNCPVCQVSTAVVDHLDEVESKVHCESCNIRYDIDFGANVEAVFRCHSALRAVQPAVYCASSPTFRPHVMAQLRVAPAQTRTESIDLHGGGLFARTLGTHEPVRIEAERAPAQVSITVDDGRLSMETRGEAAGASTKISITSKAKDEQYVLLERTGWAADAVLGSLVASLPEFVDLFGTEAPAAGNELSIGSLTLLFTDLTGSTALYDRIGDARAYAFVQEHFRDLERAIATNEGAIVKTIGDAVMATFPSPAGAVRAAIEAVVVTEAHHGEQGIGVKVGINEGPCLAVRANDRLDFFGMTVNAAARLQGQAKTGELVLPLALSEDEAIAPLLDGRPRRVYDAQLKGIEDSQRVMAVDLREPASATSRSDASPGRDPASE